MDIINEAIKRYRPSTKSMLVVDITDREIMHYLVNMSQDLSVNEDQRIEARDAVVKMLTNRNPPQVLPLFVTQEELAFIVTMADEKSTNSFAPEDREMKKRLLRSIRHACTQITAHAPAPEALPLRWEETSQHSFVDVPNVGRYLVRRRAPRSREWVALLSGKSTSFNGSREEVKAMVERFVRSVPAHEHIGRHVRDRTAKEVR
jgi:hypothetical protein